MVRAFGEQWDLHSMVRALGISGISIGLVLPSLVGSEELGCGEGDGANSCWHASISSRGYPPLRAVQRNALDPNENRTFSQLTPLELDANHRHAIRRLTGFLVESERSDHAHSRELDAERGVHLPSDKGLGTGRSGDKDLRDVLGLGAHGTRSESEARCEDDQREARDAR